MIHLRTITISKSVGFQKVELTAELDTNDDYQAGIKLLQQLTDEALKQAIESANKFNLKVEQPKPVVEQPKVLTENQIKFSRSLIEQGKLPKTFNPFGENAYAEFRAAAGDSEAFKRSLNE